MRAAEADDDFTRRSTTRRCARRIIPVVESTSFALLERLAGEVLKTVFEDRRIARADFTISKPAILDGATPSVTLDRDNPRYDPE